jgi:NitT/TauT family transport system ATP-binding protein
MDMTIDTSRTTVSAAIIEMRGLAKKFGASQALAPVTLSIGEGEFCALIGPSGCGKSTLLKLIARLHEPSAGQISWWGDDFSHVGSISKQLAFVFQDPTLMPWASAEANVRLPLDLAGVPRADSAPRVRAALEQVELAGREAA